MTRVHLERVSKVFGEYIAVRDLDLEVRDGEFLVLVGPSGCGKTTTLRMLAGLETPSYGKIWMEDKDVTLTPPGDRGISMVFQSYALYPHLTVYKNLVFGLEVRREPKQHRAERVKKVSEMLGLTGLLNRKPGNLSGGQRQRVALGRAMIHEPRLFLLDEPLSNLDAALRAQMRFEITEMQKRLGVSTVYVTHDQVEAMTMGHRIAVFSRGEVIQIGTPEQVFKNPTDKEVALFIGSPKMNIVFGRLRQNGSEPCLDFLETSVKLKDNQRQSLSHSGKQTIEIGLRPQDLHWSQDAPARCSSRTNGTVQAVERTGSESFVTVDVAGTLVNSRFPSFVPVAKGDSVEVAFDPNDLHVFDADSGRSLIAAERSAS